MFSAWFSGEKHRMRKIYKMLMFLVAGFVVFTLYYHSQVTVTPHQQQQRKIVSTTQHEGPEEDLEIILKGHNDAAVFPQKERNKMLTTSLVTQNGRQAFLLDKRQDFLLDEKESRDGKGCEEECVRNLKGTDYGKDFYLDLIKILYFLHYYYRKIENYDRA
jgi:hypothetical protein